MKTSRSFVKKTKKGAVLKVVREHYLREDVWTCWKDDERVTLESPFISQEALQSAPSSRLYAFQHLILPDTNVVLHHIDFLEFHAIVNIVLLETVLEEVKHRNVSAYKRVRSILSDKSKNCIVISNEHHKATCIQRQDGESANDRNDRTIRITSGWGEKQLESYDCRVVLLTNDRENKDKALASNLLACTVQEYAGSLSAWPELMDVTSSGDTYDGATTQTDLFSAHLSLSAFHENLKTGSVFQGTFHTQRDNPFEGHVTVSVLNGQVLIHGAAHVNRAVDGDVVGIELLPENEWSTPSDSTVLPEDEAAENEETERDDSSGIENPTSDKIRAKLDCSRKPSGRIVAIVKRNWRPYCGTLLPTNMKTSVRRLFVPMDRKIPRIVIETRQGDALDRKRIVVSIDSWPRTCRSPCGHFVRVLGDVGDKETENEVLLLEHDVPHQPFPQIVLSDLPAVPWIISDEEAKKRTDLRHLCICSVDPPGCTDIDDALHCQMLENGNYEVGVHIADVSHFVRPGTALDKEAANRGTTVYLVDKRVDMVPELLSSNLCSLRPNEDRFAMSCVWEIKPTAEIIHTQYLKSIIRSQHAFTYAEAQLRIDDKHKNDEVTKSLRSLNAMAKILKQRRVDKGALLLASPEVKFTLDDATHDPIDLEAKQLRETNSMVEEFMLLANVSVAERISREFPVCAVLRRHPQPAPSNFEPLIKAASLKGITLEVDSGKALSNSLAQAVLPGNDYFCTLIRILATRCMTQALYFCSGTEPESEYFHYGLAADIYTHYTSPIRRYADIMVHRLLATAIAADTTHPEMIDSRRVQEVCNHLNKRHRMGQYAGRASIQLSAQLFFKGKNVTENGYITSVRKNAVYVLIPKYGIELPLFLDQPSFSPPFVYNERAPSQVSGSVCLCTFDRVVVSVTLEEQDHMPGRLKLQLVEPKVHGAAVLNSDGQSLRKKRKVSST